MAFNNSKKNVYIALGSNLGNRLQHFKDAVAHIEQEIGKVIRKASLYESKAHGFASENDFLNTVICCESEKGPEEIMQLLSGIESRLGRRRLKTGYSDRPIDLDFLVYENLTFRCSTPSLTLPHPRFLQRNFALIPLLEVADGLLNEQLHNEVLVSEIDKFRAELQTSVCEF